MTLPNGHSVMKPHRYTRSLSS